MNFFINITSFFMENGIFLTIIVIFLSTIMILLKRYQYSKINQIYSHAIKKHQENQLLIIKKIEENAKILHFDKKKIILNSSISQLRSKIFKKELTCYEILICFAERAITKGKSLNLIADLSCFEDAIMEAKLKDDQINTLNPSDFSSLPPLFGIPFSVKEQLRVKNTITTCGYAQMLINSSKSSSDSVFVNILRSQGAIPLITSNVPQGLFSIEARNNIYGIAKNPWNKKRITGGSSGGEGGLTASKCNVFGLASDAAGSIRIPAGFCGVFGFKPTQKRISIKGRLGVGTQEENIRDSPATIGPMARNVDDLVEIMKSSFGNFNKFDLEICPMKFQENIYKEIQMKKMKIGIIKSCDFFESSDSVKNSIDEVKYFFEKNGHEVCDFREFDGYNFIKLFIGVGNNLGNVINKAMKNEYPEKHIESFLKLRKIPNFLKILISKILKIFVEERLSDLLKLSTLNNLENLKEIIEKKEIIKKKFFDYWQAENFDVIIAPVFPIPAPKLGEGYKLLSGLFYNLIGSMFELPCGVVPIRLVDESECLYLSSWKDNLSNTLKYNVLESDGLPLAVQVICPPFYDEKCLGIMKYMEKQFKLDYELIN